MSRIGADYRVLNLAWDALSPDPFLKQYRKDVCFNDNMANERLFLQAQEYLDKHLEPNAYSEMACGNGWRDVCLVILGFLAKNCSIKKD